MLQRRFPSLRIIKYWYSRFNDRDFSLTDKPRAGKPQKISDKELIKKVKENPTITQREIATHFNVSQPAISKRLKQIGFIQKQNIWIPHNLSRKNIEKRKSVCKKHLELSEGKNLVIHLIILQRIKACKIDC